MEALETQGIIVGVDTHLDEHVAAVVDRQGRLLGTGSFRSTTAGHRALLAWASGLGDIGAVGMEGTGSYGSGLARFLAAQSLTVYDVNRPNRQARRMRGKTDVIDAEMAARSVLAGESRTTPKAANGSVESLRILRLARRSAVKARTQTANQLRALTITAPEPLRDKVRGLSTSKLVAEAVRWRQSSASTALDASKLAMRALARRHRDLDAEVKAYDVEVRRLVACCAPGLLALPNVGAETAAALLVTAGDNPERLHSEGAFAHLCGVAPRSASSGKTRRHRLNRGGDRLANSALYTIALGRMYRDQRTIAYVERRTAEGLSKREIMRCLKRFIAREVYGVLVPALRSS